MLTFTSLSLPPVSLSRTHNLSADSFAPNSGFIRRVEALRAQLADSAGMKGKMEEKEQEAVQAKKSLKVKEQEMEDVKWRLQAVEKKLQKAVANVRAWSRRYCLPLSCFPRFLVLFCLGCNNISCFLWSLTFLSRRRSALLLCSARRTASKHSRAKYIPYFIFLRSLPLSLSLSFFFSFWLACFRTCFQLILSP